METNNKIPFEGFTRILIDENYTAVAPRIAMARGIVPKVGFRRADGWSLGAPAELERRARELWAKEWTHIIRINEREWSPI